MKRNMLPAILGTAIILTLMLSPTVAFIMTHHRFAQGYGEVLNWMFGL